MPLTDHQNTIWQQVLDPLHDLLAGEFAAAVPIWWDTSTPPKGSEWITVTPLTDEYLDRQHPSSTRHYTVRFDYFLRAGGSHQARLQQLVTLRIEQLHHVLYDNSDYSPSGTYRWHDGKVEKIDYQAATEEDAEDGLTRVSVVWSCTSTEIM
jgi:hypothetical protein